MLFAIEFDDYNSHLFVFFSGLFPSFLTEVTYLEWEIGRCNRDDESPLKGLKITT